MRRTRLLGWVLIAAMAVGGYYFVCWLQERAIARRIFQRREAVLRYARAYHLPAGLIEAVIRAESSGRSDAVSGRGAKGLMQVTEGTEAEVVERLRIRKRSGGEPLFDPDYNIQIGAAYLRMMVNRFDGDVYLALAAYNMGPTKLTKLLRDHENLPGREVVEQHAPKETRAYCRRIFRLTEGKYEKLPVTGS